MNHINNNSLSVTYPKKTLGFGNEAKQQIKQSPSSVHDFINVYDTLTLAGTGISAGVGLIKGRLAFLKDKKANHLIENTHLGGIKLLPLKYALLIGLTVTPIISLLTCLFEIDKCKKNGNYDLKKKEQIKDVLGKITFQSMTGPLYFISTVFNNKPDAFSEAAFMSLFALTPFLTKLIHKKEQPKT